MKINLVVKIKRKLQVNVNNIVIVQQLECFLLFLLLISCHQLQNGMMLIRNHISMIMCTFLLSMLSLLLDFCCSSFLTKFAVGTSIHMMMKRKSNRIEKIQRLRQQDNLLILVERKIRVKLINLIQSKRSNGWLKKKKSN